MTLIEQSNAIVLIKKMHLSRLIEIMIITEQQGDNLVPTAQINSDLSSIKVLKFTLLNFTSLIGNKFRCF